MDSAVAVMAKGFGSLLWTCMYVSIEAIRSGTLWNMPLRRALPVSSRNHRSTRFNQEPEVAVLCSWNRGCLASKASTSFCLPASGARSAHMPPSPRRSRPCSAAQSNANARSYARQRNVRRARTFESWSVTTTICLVSARSIPTIALHAGTNTQPSKSGVALAVTPGDSIIVAH
jgi:hypothetical protein